MNGPSALGLGAVPRFLTLYLACTPCTASASHAAWETAAGFGRLRLGLARLTRSLSQPKHERARQQRPRSA